MARDDTRDDTRNDVDERLDELTKTTGGRKTRTAESPVAEDFAATPVGRGDAGRPGSRGSAAAGAGDGPPPAAPARKPAGSASRSRSGGSATATAGAAKSRKSRPASSAAAGASRSRKTPQSGSTSRTTGEATSAAGPSGAVGDVEASERALDEGWSDLAPIAEGTGGEAGPSTGLLSFYDRLRERILAAVERRGGKLGPATVRALLLVPDVFILLVRLAFDREVPASARAMIGGALAYFILPMDLFPEAMFGAAGYVDDLVLATAVLAHAFGGELEPYARKHWSGPEDVRKVLADVSGAAQGLLGENLYERLRGLLKKRGIEIDSPR